MAKSKKAAPKKAVTKKKAPAKKASAKKASASPKSSPGLASLLKKIEIELEDGKKKKFSEKEIIRAEKCLDTAGKIKLSFKRVSFDGTGTGTGGGGTGTGTGID